MAKRRNDYRITRQGRGVNIDKKNEEVIISLEIICPFCNEQTRHDKVKRFVHSKAAYFLVCRVCKKRRFDEFVDRSGYKSPESKKGRLIQSFQEYLWDWIRDEIEKIVDLEFPKKINVFTGKRGNPRRHKGEPIYSSSELHPDFLKYLETPEYIKRLSQALKTLERNDPELFDYFFFRAAGYSFKQIDDIGHFKYPLTKPEAKSRHGKNHGTYESTDFCESMNRKLSIFLIDSIPQDLLETFDGGPAAIKEITDNKSKRIRKRSDKLVICPKCGGSDESCKLCYTPKTEWDGMVPEWLVTIYEKKIARGETWD